MWLEVVERDLAGDLLLCQTRANTRGNCSINIAWSERGTSLTSWSPPLVFRISDCYYPSSGATNHDDSVTCATRSAPAAQRTETHWTGELGLVDFCFRLSSRCRQWHSIRLRSWASSTVVHTSAPRAFRPYHSLLIIHHAGSLGVGHSKVLRRAVFENFHRIERAVVVHYFPSCHHATAGRRSSRLAVRPRLAHHRLIITCIKVRRAGGGGGGMRLIRGRDLSIRPRRRKTPHAVEEKATLYARYAGLKRVVKAQGNLGSPKPFAQDRTGRPSDKGRLRC